MPLKDNMRYWIVSLIMFAPMTVFASTIADVETAVMDKDYAQGRDIASKILKSTADVKARINAEYYLGLCELRLGQFTKARTAFMVVLGAATTQEMYEKAALGLVEGLYMAGYYKDALKEGKKILSKYPNCTSKSLVYLKMARAHLKLMQWDEAKNYLNKLIQEFPQSFEAPIAKGLLEEKEFFSLQVGSFLDQDKALHLVDDLKSKNQYAYIVETTSPDGKKFYRVRVGQMASLDQAKSVQTQLSRQGYPSLIYP